MASRKGVLGLPWQGFFIIALFLLIRTPHFFDPYFRFLFAIHYVHSPELQQPLFLLSGADGVLRGDAVSRKSIDDSTRWLAPGRTSCTTDGTGRAMLYPHLPVAKPYICNNLYRLK